MAAITMYVHHKDSPTPAGLCPFCDGDRLKLYTYQRVDMDGITILGHRAACNDCRKFIEPTKEIHQ